MSNKQMLIEILQKLEITDEIKAEVQKWFDRAKNIPELKIVEKRLPIEAVLRGTFTEEEMEVRPGSAKDNHIEIKIHNDSWYFSDTYMQTSGNKLMTYRVIRQPLGLISIETTAGNQSRNQDYRRERLEGPLRQMFHFVCVEGEAPYYQHYKDLFGVDEDQLTENQLIAVKRKEEAEYITNLLQPYILRYVLIVRSGVLNTVENTNSPLKYSTGHSPRVFWRKMKELEQFIKETRFYLQCMLILNQLDVAEYNELVIRLDRTDSYIATAKRVLSHKFDQMKLGASDSFHIGLEYDDKDPKLTEEENEKKYTIEKPQKRYVGPVQKVIEYVEWLLSVRKECLVDVKSLMEGYIHIDDEGRLYPNLTEIERRKDLYTLYGDSTTEQEFQQYIRDKKGKGNNK